MTTPDAPRRLAVAGGPPRGGSQAARGHAPGGGGGGGAGRAPPGGGEPVRLDPADFVSQTDNPYWPMAPGSTWVYEETDAEGNVQRVEGTVTERTRRTLDIAPPVAPDVATES